MKRRLKGLCGAGALVLPLSVWAAPVVEDLTEQPRSFYDQTEVREEAGGNLVLFNQLQENQREIQQLRGQLEELRYQLEQLRRLSQERYLDLEERFMAGGALTDEGQAGTQVDADVAREVATAPSRASALNGDAQAAYQQAFQHVQNRDFPAAIEAFEAFVGNYPDNSLTANGYYWLGELYSAQSDLEPAAQAFERVINDHPQSNKVPDALYKLGLLRARQGQPEASRELLTRVRNDYPESSAAGMANDFLNQSGL
ncbi:tol-pal system protein YbgF [Litchfieldella qijiaojingensis]|uniref:Cell division coordinator CpoB n=1 Tax=Litchfieldella qijiaojingensis TaxID=980347 RepID=A0ABQ2YCG8_9GAMM|nr:tol-pal system protein YbgF [Halomonas qijiaojingensis]GGX79221.1 tol-pal system protein YbgF [Halomonas qijiaojingensis]